MRKGIEFDRMLLWEAIARQPSAVLEGVPKELRHAYQVRPIFGVIIA